MGSLVPALIAGGSTAAALPVVHSVLTRHGVVDAANDRSSHTGQAVRGLGVAAVIGWMVAVPFLVRGDRSLWAALLVGPVAVSVVGFGDDFLGGLEPRVRFIATGAFAGIIAFGIVDGTGSAALWVVLGLVWILYFTNAFNFMDGIDGISATAVVVMGSAFGLLGHRIDTPIVSEAGLALALTALAFGVINMLGTRKFLGDAGSYFYGSALGALALATFLGGASAVAVAGIMALYVSDTTVAILRRALRRERLADAHRQHVYQRLVDAGLSHAGVDLVVGAAMVSTASVGVWADDRSSTGQLVAAAAISLVVLAYLLAPNANGESFSRTGETPRGGG